MLAHIGFVLLALLFAPLAPARAALAPADLDAVGITPPPGASLPRDGVFTDQDGTAHRLGDLLSDRPVVFLFADYQCREICGPILAVAGAALGGTGLVAGRDYDLIAVGFNPQATPADAARMGAAQLGPLAKTAHLLGGTPEAVGAVERAFGYRAAYDSDNNRYAHPAAVLVLTGAGQVSRLLPGLSLDSDTLRLALVEAGHGRIGTLGDQLHLLCYGIDPAHGVANGVVTAALAGGGALTLAGLGFFVFGLARRADRHPERPLQPSFRGGEAEAGTDVVRRWTFGHTDSGSSLRSVRNEGATKVHTDLTGSSS